MEASLQDYKLGSLGCLTPSQVVPKLGTHNLVCGPMYVSNWPKRPNMVPKSNLGGNFTFLCHSPLGRGVLSFAPTTIEN